MAIHLKVHGPLEIPYHDNGVGSAKHIDKSEKEQFLKLLHQHGLSFKHGCYIFALRAGPGYCPWYIGKAAKGMRQECMGPHQLNHYNAVLFKGLKGTPVIFFISPEGRGKKVPKQVCDDIETFLIQSALHENPDLRNVQKTKVPEWSIDGVVRGGQGKPKIAEAAFKTMMGLK